MNSSNMSKGRKRLFNPGQGNRNRPNKQNGTSTVSRKRFNKSKRARMAAKKRNIFSGDIIKRNRLAANERNIINIQNSVSIVNFSIANCNEVLKQIKEKNDRSTRSFAVQLSDQLHRYEDLKKRRLIHLTAAMGYTGEKRLPRKRSNSIRMNEHFKCKIKKYGCRNRKSRLPANVSLNLDVLQEDVTQLLTADECQVQGLEVIELSDYDSETNEGETYAVEDGNSKRTARKKHIIRGKGARGNNITELYDEDDIFIDRDSHRSKYQFAIDLKFKDKYAGE